MKVLYVEPLKEPAIVDIPDDPDSMCRLVKGLIACIYPWEDEIGLVHNDNAIAQGLEPNRVVGKNIILQSDIENQYIQYRLQGMAEGTGKEVRANILEELLLQKLMLNQAEMDSITVTDEQVEAELNRKIQYAVSRLGSQEKLEAQFGKTMSEIKSPRLSW